MDILNYITKKTSIEESFKINKNTFISKEGYTYRKNLDSKYKMFYKSTLIARNNKEIVNLESFLTKNITKLIVQPIYSTLEYSSTTINTNSLIVGFKTPFLYKEDFLLYGSNVNNLNKIGIIEYNYLTQTITLENYIDINEGDMLIVGKTMTLSKNIGINRKSNTFWEFQINTEEL